MIVTIDQGISGEILTVQFISDLEVCENQGVENSFNALFLYLTVKFNLSFENF